MRILVQRHNWAIFFLMSKKWTYIQWQLLSGHIERIFVHKNSNGNIWFQQDDDSCHTVEATLDVFWNVFKDHIISCRGDAVWPLRSCDLTLLDYYLWGAVKKSETIDPLKDNIREAIGEIQLHAIDNVLKNCTDRVGYCMFSRSSLLNEIIFHY